MKAVFIYVSLGLIVGTTSIQSYGAVDAVQGIFMMNSHEMKGLKEQLRKQYLHQLAQGVAALKSANSKPIQPANTADLEKLSHNEVDWQLLVNSVNSACSKVPSNEKSCSRMEQDRLDIFDTNASH